MRFCLLFLLGIITASAQESGYLEMHKSKPVESNGLQFVAAIQAQCIGGHNGTQRPIEIQLYITNKSGHDLLFPTFDTFHVVIKDANGIIIPAGGGRDGTMISFPIRINAGDTYCLSRRAQLWWKLTGNFAPAGQKTALFYWDGTGTENSYTISQLGHYSLSFAIDVEKDQPPAKPGLPPLWIGTVTTPDAPFEIIED